MWNYIPSANDEPFLLKWLCFYNKRRNNKSHSTFVSNFLNYVDLYRGKHPSLSLQKTHEPLVKASLALSLDRSAANLVFMHFISLSDLPVICWFSIWGGLVLYCTHTRYQKPFDTTQWLTLSRQSVFTQRGNDGFS